MKLHTDTIRKTLRPALLLARGLFWLGSRHICPICGWRCRAFLDYQGEEKRTGAVCPRCGSLERHRLLWLYLRTVTESANPLRTVLHFAPEPCLRSRLQGIRGMRYVCSDMDSVNRHEHIDVCHIPFAEGTFDLIICCHVLEHVADDRAAVGEIRRVLKDGGLAVIQVPVDFHRPQTYEDASITSPEMRRLAFGQTDHFRVYGADFANRLGLEGAAFSQLLPADVLPDDADRVRYGVQGADPILICVRQVVRAGSLNQ